MSVELYNKSWIH